jgi:saccharopine dehydrogenase-like NADP-dependent oxidoreductase
MPKNKSEGSRTQRDWLTLFAMDTKKIILFGAGRSARHLVSFLVEGALLGKWTVLVADTNVSHWFDEYGHLNHVEFIAGDASDAKFRQKLIAHSNLVISMLPAFMHAEVVKDCINFHVHVFTPSYVSPEVNTMNERAIQEGVLVLNEMGVDPGIDHISAMEIIHRLKSQGAEIESFESYTGGLVAPASDDNLWGYKISWNPRNIILAGSSGHAMYRENNKLRMVPYFKLFDEVETVVASDGVCYDAYANRNSVHYLELYGLENVHKLVRGTLRKQGYCKGWSFLVKNGFVNDDTKIPAAAFSTWEDLSQSLLGVNFNIKNENEQVADMLQEIGIFSNELLSKEELTCAQHLQQLLEKKWVLKEGDCDMIVMVHKFGYTLKGKKFMLTSSLVLEGDDELNTAMSKTVGMPIAFAVDRLFNGDFSSRGVQIPVSPEFYKPLLQDLHNYGISFVETLEEL